MKFTDDEIIKALECCRTIDGNDCSTCPYYGKHYEIGSGGCSNHLVNDALALINRQKAEIEKLNAQKRGYSIAIKEFAERLKGKAEFTTIAGYISYGRLIDNLVKEMTESDNESQNT